MDVQIVLGPVMSPESKQQVDAEGFWLSHESWSGIEPLFPSHVFRL